MSFPLASLSPRRGRPRKYAEPSKTITLTLPVSVVETLSDIDRDVARAIVRLAEGKRQPNHPPAELVAFGRRAVIVVNASLTLEHRTGVMLVPFSDGRSLICFDGSMTPARLELMIQDVLDEGGLQDEELAVYAAIRDILKDARRSAKIALQQRQIMVLEVDGADKRTHRDTRPIDN